MRSLRAWALRLAGVFDGGRRDRDAADELESHLAFHIDDNLRAGMTPAEARRRAVIALGGIEQTKERLRDRGGVPMFEVMARDLRHGYRRLLRTPGASLAILITLAAALGLNASVFAVADALVLRPFSIPHLDDLVLLSETRPDSPIRGLTSPANFLDWKRQTKTLMRLSAGTVREVEVGGNGNPERLPAAFVSVDFFELIGAAPALGRGFVAGEEMFGRHRSVVLAHRLWLRLFASDPAIVGQSIVLDGMRHQIVGIAAPTLDFPVGSELWAPLAFDAAAIAQRDRRSLMVIGRLAEGASIQTAQSEMAIIAEDLTRRYPEANAGRRVRVQTLADGLTEEGMGALHLLLQASALFVLLIACANITNILVALGVERQREIAVRFALGATRAQIFRSLWLESSLLALLSVPLALAVAAGGLKVLAASMPARLASVIPGWRTIDVDGRLTLFTIILALGAAGMFGLLSALQASEPNLDALKEAARGLTAGVRRQRLRRGLIVAQVALVLPLLVAAELSGRGTARFLNGPQGYEPDGLLTARLALPERQYANADAQRQFATAVLDRLDARGAIRAAAIANVLPSSGLSVARQVALEGQTTTRPDLSNAVEYRVVSPSYFDTLGIRIVKGRGFNDADREGAQPVAIVSTSMADRYWPGADPLGRHLRAHRDNGEAEQSGPWVTVVGVSDDVIHDWFWARNAPTLYRPYTQDPARGIALAIRTTGEPAAAAIQVRSAIHAVDAERPLFDVMTMEQILSERLTAPRQIAVLMGTLGGLALVLAAIGLYGVIACLVSQRAHEIGLRLALGATRGDILRLVFGQASRLAVVGVLLGAFLALATARLVEAALVGIASLDLVLLVVLMLAVTAVALAAAYVPARRALAIEPSIALRNE